MGKWIPGAVAVMFLLSALGDWPYAYYQFTRWVVAGVGAWLALVALEKRPGLAAVVGATALLFNPVIPFHLQRETWQVLDMIAAVVMAAGTVMVARQEDRGTIKASDGQSES